MGFAMSHVRISAAAENLNVLCGHPIQVQLLDILSRLVPNTVHHLMQGIYHGICHGICNGSFWASLKISPHQCMYRILTQKVIDQAAENLKPPRCSGSG